MKNVPSLRLHHIVRFRELPNHQTHSYRMVQGTHRYTPNGLPFTSLRRIHM